MSIKNRIAKLETKYASGGLVLINFYPATTKRRYSVNALAQTAHRPV